MGASRSIRLPSDKIAFNTLGYIIVFIFGMLCVVPFYLVLISSLESEGTILREGYSLIVRDFSLEAYKLSFKSPERILWAYRNTIMATLVGTACSILIATMTGYVLQRKDFPWRNKLSFFFFFTTLFHGGLVPTYILCTRYLGFKNSYRALLLPLMFSVWNMIIAKTFIRGIPYEITESAKIDGAGDFSIYAKLILPLSTPLIATLGLFSALAYWNDWFSSLLYITKDDRVSLQYFLQQMINSIQALKTIASRGGTINETALPQETMKMAMTVITTGPIIFAYPFVQRFFIKGLTIGAVKG